MTLIVSDQDGGTEGCKRDTKAGGRGEGSIIAWKELKSESHKIAKGDAMGQSGPFVCVCVATVNRCQVISSLPAYRDVALSLGEAMRAHRLVAVTVAHKHIHTQKCTGHILLPSYRHKRTLSSHAFSITTRHNQDILRSSKHCNLITIC